MQARAHHIPLLFVVMAASIAAMIAVRPAPPAQAGLGEIPAVQQVLRFQSFGDYELDPAYATGMRDRNVLNQLFRGLTVMRGKEEVQPGAAQSWTVSADKRVWTFTLREGMHWSDGTPLTSGHFKYGWLRNMAPSTKSPLADRFADIQGATAYHNGTANITAVGISAPTPRVLRITTTHPVPWMLRLVSDPLFYPLPTHVIRDHGTHWTEPANIVSNGPFTLDSRTADTTTLNANPLYWGADNLHLTSIVLRHKTRAGAFDAYLAGNLNGGFPGSMITADDQAAAEADPGYREFVMPSTQLLWFNTTDPRLADRRVRAGMSKMIDRRNLAANTLPISTFSILGQPGASIVRAGHGGFINPNGAPDGVVATQLLEDGGWSGPSEGPLRLVYTTEGAAGVQAVIDAIDETLTAAGVPVTQVKLATFAQVLAATTSTDNNYDLAFLGWNMDYADEYNLLSLVHTTSPNNVSGWGTANYNAKLTQIAGSMADSARFELEQDAERMLTSATGSHPAAPLYQNLETTLIDPTVVGETVNAMGIVYLDRVEITG